MNLLLPSSYLTDGHGPTRTLVELRRQNKSQKYAAEFDVLLIDAPPLPPKPPSPPASPTHTVRAEEPPAKQSKEQPSEKAEPKALAQQEAGKEVEEKSMPTPDAEPELEDSDPLYPWYRRRLHSPTDNTSKYTAAQPSLFPRSDFALSTSGSSRGGLNLLGGLVNDRAKNDVYTISVHDHSVTRLFTIGDIPPPRFGQAGACAGSVAVVWGGDTTSASSNQLSARAKYDNGLYFLNLGQ